MVGTACIGSIGYWNISHSQCDLIDYSEKLLGVKLLKLKYLVLIV